MATERDPLYVQLRVDLHRHRRFADLLAYLDDVPGFAELPEKVRRVYAYGCLARLWSEAMDREMAEGDFTGWSAAAIAFVTDWAYDRERWHAALLGSGFLECVDGRVLIHNWPEFSGKLFVKRAKDATRKREDRRDDADVQWTSGGHPADVQPISAQNGRPGPDVDRTSSRAESRELREETGERELNEAKRSVAHARAREADDEDDEFLRTANDDPGTDDISEPEAEAVPFVDDEPPGVIAKLRPLDERVRKERPASGGQLDELQHFFRPQFEALGAVQVFHDVWTRLTSRYPLATARWLNDRLEEDLQRVKARTLPPIRAVEEEDPMAAWERRATADLLAARERQGMPVPDFLRTA